MGLSIEQINRAAGVRERLLACAARLLTTVGVQGLTLDAVAREADVSKGGLLHHFSSKSDLLQALMEGAYTKFVSRIDELTFLDAEKHGRYTRAYIKASLDPEAAHGQASIIMALLLDPTLKADWLLKVESLLQKDITEYDSVLAKILRLAADGLWLSEAFAIHKVSTFERVELEMRLIALTRPSAGRSVGS